MLPVLNMDMYCVQKIKIHIIFFSARKKPVNFWEIGNITMLGFNDAYPADQGLMSADSIVLIRNVNNL